MSKIKMKFDYVDGDFDTDNGKLVSVRMKNHVVLLCFVDGMNIPFSRIKLYDSDLYRDAKATSDDALDLGNEIARRWNEYADQQTRIAQLESLISEAAAYLDTHHETTIGHGSILHRKFREIKS